KITCAQESLLLVGSCNRRQRCIEAVEHGAGSDDQGFASNQLTEIRKQKQSVFDDRPADGTADQVFPRTWFCDAKSWRRVGCALRPKVRGGSMPIVGPRHGDNVDQTSRGTSELGIKVTRQNLNLTNGALTKVERYEKFCLGKVRP